MHHRYRHAVGVVGAPSPEELFDVVGIVEDDKRLAWYVEPNDRAYNDPWCSTTRVAIELTRPDTPYLSQSAPYTTQSLSPGWGRSARFPTTSRPGGPGRRPPRLEPGLSQVINTITVAVVATASAVRREDIMSSETVWRQDARGDDYSVIDLWAKHRHVVTRLRLLSRRSSIA